MSEVIFHIDVEEPVAFYGVNDSNMAMLQRFFSNLKIVVRNNQIKVIGDERSINEFTEKLNLMLEQYEEYGPLNEQQVSQLLSGGVDDKASPTNNDILVYGPNGLLVKARTRNQKRMVTSNIENDVVFAIGPAGTGKTHTAVALAVKALKNKEVKRIVLTRPAVEAGENLGFLPGDLKEKIDPYLRPLYDALYDMLGAEKVKTYIEKNVIEVAPLAFMRGRTLDHAFVILDEAQNATENQLKMFLTRMGPSAKFIVTGDITQVDLPRNQPSGLIQAIKLLKNIRGIDFIELDGGDVVRHRLVKEIIEAYNSKN